MSCLHDGYNFLSEEDDISWSSFISPGLYWRVIVFVGIHWIFIKTGATSGPGTAYPSGAHMFIRVA